MEKYATALLGIVAVILVFCQDGSGLHTRSRCFRICEHWNGFPEHLNGFPGKARRLLLAKSVSQIRSQIEGCDCSQFQLNTNFHREKRSIHSSIQPTPRTNSSKGTPNTTITSKPGKEHDTSLGLPIPDNIFILPHDDAGLGNGTYQVDDTSKPRGKPPNIDPLLKGNQSSLACKDPPDRMPDRTWKVTNITTIFAQNLSVDFIQNGSNWLANVTWLPPLDNRLYGYIVVWSHTTDVDENSMSFLRCKEVLNNQTFTILDRSNSGWKYPRLMHIKVLSLPGFLDLTGEHRDYYFENFRPSAKKGKFPITLEPPRVDNSLKYGSLLAGVLAGILLIVILVFVLYRRKTCGSPGGEGHSIIPMTENNNPEGFVKINNTTKPQNNDTYFASYLPENEKYSNEVANIAYKLGTMGYRVVFDKVDSVHMNEIGFNMWVDKQILESKKYIVFCTPGYVRLWQSLTTSSIDNSLSYVDKEDLVRVRYEIKRISDVYSESCSTSRIVCIKMDPKMSTKLLPPWMNHNMLTWPEQKEDVMRRLNDQAAMVMHV